MKKLIACSLLLLSNFTYANKPALANDFSSKLSSLGLTNAEIVSAPIDNLQMVIADEGIFYITKDGKHLIEGKVFGLNGNKGLQNLTNQALVNRINKLSNSVIAFPAKNQKYVVNIFIDVGCKYCTKMFEQRKEYNDLGITLRFLPFPRKGLSSYEASTLEAIWTSPNPIQALTEAEVDKKYPAQMKTPNIVRKTFALGVALGLNGTPATLLPNGRVISGYLTPEELIGVLQR